MSSGTAKALEEKIHYVFFLLSQWKFYPFINIKQQQTLLLNYTKAHTESERKGRDFRPKTLIV